MIFRSITLEIILPRVSFSTLETSYLDMKSHIESKSAQSAFTCSKLTIETLEQGVKHVQS